MTTPMGDEPQARPLSGEILPAGAQPARGAFSNGEVIDADYVTLDSENRQDQRHDQPSAPAEPAPPPGGMAMLRKNQAAPPPPARSRGGAGFWLFGLALAAGAFWISGGHALVRQLPAALPAAPLEPLRIENFTSRIDGRGERAVLIVDGAVANGGPAPLTVPPLVISVTAGDGRVTRYILGTNDAPVLPGGRFAFSSRLAVPKDGGTSVSVTFQDKPD